MPRPSGSQVLALSRKRRGDTYVLGVLVPKDNPRWPGPWDCAEFCSWLVYQVGAGLYGVFDPLADPAMADAYTGYWARDARALGTEIPVEEAAAIPGSFILRAPAGRRGGHIVVSDGRGGTVEAHSARRGVIASTLAGRRWDTGILPRGIQYEPAGPALEVPPPNGRILRLAAPRLTGTDVRAAQRALRTSGFDPGPADGVYGPQTEAAVIALQLAKGLVSDGEVGPQTARWLGITLRAA